MNGIKTYPQFLQFTIVSRFYVGLVTRGFRAKVSQTYTVTAWVYSYNVRPFFKRLTHLFWNVLNHVPLKHTTKCIRLV